MDRTIQNTKMFSGFLENLRAIFSFDKLLVVDATNFKSFEADEMPGNRITGMPEEVIKKIKDQETKYSLIFEFFPFGMILTDWEGSSNEKHKLPLEYTWILESLKCLEENGVFLTILPPSILFSNKGKQFEQILNSLGYYFSAVFNLPNLSLEPLTRIRPILLAIRKRKSDKLFISEIDYSSDFAPLLKHYSEGSSESIEAGIFIARVDFTSFEDYKITQQINNLQTQYKSYSEYYLEKVANKLNTTKTNFIEFENSLYIPKIGTSLPVSNLKVATLKHQNYFQVVLKPDIVNAQYLEVFFTSQMGLLILGTLKRITFIPHINKSDLLKIKIPIPDLETQNLIIETSKNIKKLEEQIRNFKSQLSLNPNSANKIKGILNNALNSLGQINEEDQILELIRQGESKTLEFKQTFSKDAATNSKDIEKSIRESSLKNIVAFLNSEGGTLLIGVKNNGEIFGLENDYFENDDKYLLNFSNNIKDHIGEDFHLFLNWKIVTVSNKKILRVDCKMSSKAFFLNGIDFYVRTNPRTDKLVGPKLANYLKERFN